MEVGLGGVRWLGRRGESFSVVCWKVLVLVLRVMGRFGEAVEVWVKAYWTSLPPKPDLGASSVSGVGVGSFCVFAMVWKVDLW